jgi:hypothetical protein
MQTLQKILLAAIGMLRLGDCVSAAAMEIFSMPL